MRQKEPFAFARNLKIFIIVLCVLPLIGIAMLIFLPKQLNGVTAEVLPAVTADFDFDALYNAVKSGSREYDEDVKKAVDGLIGDVSKTMTITAKLIADGDRAIFVAPYNTGESGYVGIKLYIFKINYAHYGENEFCKAFPVLPDVSK